MTPSEDLAELRREVEYLKDRLAILDCISQHSRGHDRHDSDLITAAYHDDGVDEHGAAINPGLAYADWINPVHAAGSQAHTHNITTHTCEIDGRPPTARATYWSAYSTTTESPLG